MSLLAHITNIKTARRKRKPRKQPKTDDDVLKAQFSSGFVGDYTSFHIAGTMAAAAGDGNGSVARVSGRQV